MRSGGPSPIRPGRSRIQAGAGSGKTRVLTRRIAYRAANEDLDPRHVVALTFTRKAAGELGQRLAHASACATPSPSAPSTRSPTGSCDPAGPTVGSPRRPSCSARWASSPDSCPRAPPPTQRRSSARSNGPRPGWCRPGSTPRSPTPRVAAPPMPAAQLGELFAAYEAEKRRRRLVDFDDLLRLACFDLGDDREFAVACHWRHRHFFVDEFQDVNPLQFALLQAWLGNRDDLCVVGDPNQAIYGWNGADAHHLVDFGDYYPTAPTIVLDENHRSTPQVLGRGPGGARRPERGSGRLDRVTHPDRRRRSPRCTPTTTRRRRPPASPAPSATCTGPARRGRGRRCWSAPTRRSRPIERALQRRRHPVPGAGAGRPGRRPDHPAGARPAGPHARRLRDLRRRPRPRAVVRPTRSWSSGAPAIDDLAGGPGRARRGRRVRPHRPRRHRRRLRRLAPRPWRRRPHPPTRDAVELVHLPRRQGPRVADRPPRRHRAGLRPHLPRPHPRRPRRGAAPPLRGHHPRRARCCSAAGPGERTFGERTVDRQPSEHLAAIEATIAGWPKRSRPPTATRQPPSSPPSGPASTDAGEPTADSPSRATAAAGPLR